MKMFSVLNIHLSGYLGIGAFVGVLIEKGWSVHEVYLVAWVIACMAMLVATTPKFKEITQQN